MSSTYLVKVSDPANALFEGQTVIPYYEDGKEIVIPGPRLDVDHHIRKDGEYFAKHFKPIGGK